MSLSSNSGSSTPLSSTTTLSAPPSPKLKNSADPVQHGVYFNPRIHSSSIIEYISSRATSSSTVYIYDLAEQAGFGTLTKEWSKSLGQSAPVVDLQTRPGAGLSLVGRLSEGTSQDTVKGAVLTAYTTPSGLCMMAPSLPYLPPATPTSRLIIQVPTVVPLEETFSLSPSLAHLASVLPILPEDLVVLFSATPQQSVDFATLSYKLTKSHVIHLFDHQSSAREIGHSIIPLSDQIAENGTVKEIINQAGYEFFDYSGDIEAQTVIVLLNGPLALAAKAIANQTTGLGIVVVNVLRPWDEAALRRILPATARSIHVLDDVPNAAAQGALYIDIFGSLLEQDVGYTVHGHRFTPSQTQQYLTHKNSFFQFLRSVVPTITDTHPPSPATLKKLLFFSIPQTPLASIPYLIEDLFLSSKGIRSRLLTDYDALSKAGGVVADRLLISSKSDTWLDVPIPIALPLDSTSTGEVDFLAILDHSLLKSHHTINYAKPGSVVLVVSNWSAAELLANLPSGVISLILTRNIRLFTIDAKNLASKLLRVDEPATDAVQSLLVHLAFLRLYLGSAANESAVLKAAQITSSDILHGISVSKINAHAWAGLEEIYFTPSGSPSNEATATLKDFDFNTVVVKTEEGETIINGARLSSWHDAAKHILFPSVFIPTTGYSHEYADTRQNPALHPELSDRTFLVTCSVNRRLTPLEYNRNVFHLEFDTTGTGLKYALGEALGVHGWNDEKEVLDFCAWYGVDPDRLITIPLANGEGYCQTRTVLQVLQQQIDIFGRPPKSFYTDLAAYATSSVDKHALLFIGSAEGSSTFKKLSETDTLTFADVLTKYASAKPGIERLCEIIGEIKPRHYSIASAQSVVGNRVDLLVVTVDWETPNGTTRYGQCTRYLAGLRIGQKVTVSIKPSVMKLPPVSTQPIIMAGLGTGAAPFRAFLQHLAFISEQGQEIGPVYYYFGSRHQSQEYLYGEEIEAFILNGIISKAGLAFSRDGPKKVYIQDKMLEDSEILVNMLHSNKGVFYLCGPTWPVPDVYEALVAALVKYKGLDVTVAGEYLEGLKEEERYVLEVY